MNGDNMLIELEGDLTKFDAKYLVHQCNCVTNRAAHLAKTMFTAFPWADIYSEREKIDYRNLPEEQKPGNIIIRKKDDKHVIAILGQVFPGSPKFPDSPIDGIKAREKYFIDGLKKILEIKDLESIAFPDHIGCGAAGGNWEFYKKLIERFSIKSGEKVKTYIVKYIGD